NHRHREQELPNRTRQQTGQATDGSPSYNGNSRVSRLLPGVVRRLLDLEVPMRNEFTAIIEHEDDWYIGYCPEIPGANGQGRTIEEGRRSLADAIALILEDRGEEAFAASPPTPSARR